MIFPKQLKLKVNEVTIVGLKSSPEKPIRAERQLKNGTMRYRFLDGIPNNQIMQEIGLLDFTSHKEGL